MYILAPFSDEKEDKGSEPMEDIGMEEEVKEKGESGAVEGPGAGEVWVLVVLWCDVSVLYHYVV